MFGTPEWMAPEVMCGEPYDKSVDIYSFGILLCELVSRVVPFSDTHNFSCYEDVCHAVLDLQATPSVPPWVPADLKDLILSCLSHRPSSRPTGTRLLQSLRSLKRRYINVGDRTETVPRGIGETDQREVKGAGSLISPIDMKRSLY